MNNIEQLQNKLRDYLISIIPVPWTKICYYAECAKGSSSFWYGFIEKETGVVSTYEFFFNRYDNYAHNRIEVTVELLDYAEKLYKEYIDTFSKEKAWQTMVYIINEDRTIDIDYSYEKPQGDIFS